MTERPPIEDTLKPTIEDVLLQHQLRTREPREELIRGPSGPDFSFHDFSIRIVDLPLFRRSEGEELLQVVRVVARAESEQGNVAFSVSNGSRVLDQRTDRITKGRNLIDLFIPEIHETRSFTFEMASGAGQPFRAQIEVHPQRKWSIFLINQSHLDIGYTDTQASILQHHLQYLDSVLDLVSATDDWPEAAQFRWNVEGSWPLRSWLAGRPTRDRDVFIERVHQGRVEICALPFSMHTEAYSIDELARQLRFTDELREQYDLPITTAMQTDVPGATIGLLNTLVDADVRYLSVAHNYAGRSVPYLVGGQQLTRPFYWQAPNGERLLVWYTDTPHGSAYMEGNFVGLAESYDTAVRVLPGYLKALAERPYPYEKPFYGWQGLGPDTEVTKQPYPLDVLHLRIQGIIADNAPPSITPARVVREWNENWAYPQLRLATNREFFSSVEERFGNRLETYRGDWTDWWVDGIGSAARLLGFNRRAQADIRSAQTLHTLADALTGDPTTPSDQIDTAYENMALFDEHTWGAADPWEDKLDRRESGSLQWAKKAAFAREAYDSSDALLKAGIHRLSHVFQASASSLASVTVFNPSSWERTDIVRVFIPLSRVNTRRPFAVMDFDTEQRVPHAEEEQQHAEFRPRGSYVSFVARNVPPFGYARYELIEESREVPSGPDTRSDPIIENDHYRLQVDPLEGLVARLLDKDSGEDLVNADAPFGFNQYIYDRYATAPHINHLSGRIQATDLSLLAKRSVARYGVVTERSSTPVWDRMTLRLEGEGVDFLETTFRLLRGVKRLDIENRLSKIGTPQKESVFFAFPFNVDQSSITYEITGGVSSPDAPHVPGSANHMRAIRHWVSLGSTATNVAWATMEAPLVQFGNIHLPYVPFPETIDSHLAHPATIYSWALNNMWDTNFPPQQQGEMAFRYSLSTGNGVGASELGMRTATALTAPLLGILSAPAAEGDLPARGSFCSVDRPDVEIVALAPSRRGHDLAVLLQSFAPTTVEVRASFPLLPVGRAWTGSHLERNLKEVEVNGSEIKLAVPSGSYISLSVDLDRAG
jgi:Glycosyl hydrolases family 38 N-terminal domain/Glycosyl hydrolases family 38 C-terminal domain